MTITVQIASLPDRENVVAELWVGDVQLAEVSNENNELFVEFYSIDPQHQLSLKYEEVVSALAEARESLVKGCSKEN